MAVEDQANIPANQPAPEQTQEQKPQTPAPTDGGVENVSLPVEEVAGGGESAENVDVAPEGKVVQYGKTDDVGLDMALDFVGRLGIGPANPGMQAAMTGDFSLLKAQLASLGQKAAGWEQYVALAEKAYQSAVSKATAAKEEVSKLQVEMAGSPEQWQAVDSWVRSNADQAELQQLDGLMKQGGVAARAAIALMTSTFNAQVGTKQPKEAVKPESASAVPTTGALSPREYQAAVQELSRKLGGAIDGSPEYAELKRRRMAWRG